MIARSVRPISRWISVPRESVWPIFGHALRCGVDAGSITYSHVIHPPARSSLNHGGTSRVTDAVQSSTVLPCSHRTDPAGVRVKFRWTRTLRNSSAVLPSCRMGGDYITGNLLCAPSAKLGSFRAGEFRHD